METYMFGFKSATLASFPSMVTAVLSSVITVASLAWPPPR